MFHVHYLTPVGFFQRDGDAIEVDLDPTQRKDGITYFTVSATIEPPKIHKCFREANSPSKTIEYTMQLPQTSSSSAIAAPGGNDGGSGGTSVDNDELCFTRPLCNPDVYLLGPFNFSPPGETATGRPKDKEHVPVSAWEELLNAVNGRGIQAPFLATPTNTPSSTTSKRRRR